MIIKSYIAETDPKIFNYKTLLFYGPNIGLKIEFKEKIKKRFKEEEFFYYNQDEILKSPEDAFTNLLNASLFEKQKIFIISQCNDKILEFIESVEAKLSDQKIYFFAEQLDKKSKLRSQTEKSKDKVAIGCYEDNEISLKKLIIDRLKEFSGITTENINLLIDNCALDRMKLKNELDKIITYFEKKKLHTKELHQILNIKSNDDFNKLRDSAINGDKLVTNKLLNDTLVENEKNIFYVALINQRLSKIKETIKLISETNLESAISKLKPPIFWKDKPVFINQINKWDSKKINQALNKTYNLEIMIKSNNLIDETFLVKKLLVDICNLANA
jgi:DNA polymerase-3 subunit delta